jgi:hypothetical protein
MNNKTTNSCPGGDESNHHCQITGDRVNYKSEDGLVEVLTKVESAKRYPRHGYPVVCLRLRPKKGTRIQLLDDGSGGVEVLFRHIEIAEHLQAINTADPKSNYQGPTVPGKPDERKAKWDAINQQRWEDRQK